LERRDMLGRASVVTVEEARRIFEGAFLMPSLAVEAVPITGALRRVLAGDVVSGVTLPAFFRSSMDGYAVRAKDTFGATDALPAYLAVTGEVLMGEEAVAALSKGQAMKISTGGMLPPGSDAVVMYEHSQTLPDGTLEVGRPVAPGENVVAPGEDVREGETLLTAGHRLRPQDLGALAGIGVLEVGVFKRPKVAVINTGNEIIDASLTPSPGQVRDVNSYNLAGLILQAGGEPVPMGIYKDDYDDIKKAVEGALDASDIVAITGGSSVGTRDLTAKVIDGLGGAGGGVLVHGVSVRPGKPVIIGLCRERPVFGLPGHPVAVTVSFELFIRPLIERLSGYVDRLKTSGIPPVRVVKARMARNYSSGPGREDHIRVALELKEGELWARPILGKSGLITTLVKADGAVVIPLAKQGLERGETVEVALFD